MSRRGRRVIEEESSDQASFEEDQGIAYDSQKSQDYQDSVLNEANKRNLQEFGFHQGSIDGEENESEEEFPRSRSRSKINRKFKEFESEEEQNIEFDIMEFTQTQKKMGA